MYLYGNIALLISHCLWAVFRCYFLSQETWTYPAPRVVVINKHMKHSEQPIKWTVDKNSGVSTRWKCSCVKEKTLNVTNREIQHQLVLRYLHHKAKVNTLLVVAVQRVPSVVEMSLVLSLTTRDAVCSCLCNK